MKFILLVSLVSGGAFAGSLDDHIAKMRRVVENDGRCEFAVASFQMPTSDLKLGASAIPTDVQCVGNITVGKGTLNERTGCSAFILDLDTAKAHGFSGKYAIGDDGIRIVDGKNCENGGFEELIKLNIHYPQIKDVTSGYSIKNWLLVLGGAWMPQNFEQRIVYVKPGVNTSGAKNTFYEEWFEKERSKSVKNFLKQK